MASADATFMALALDLAERSLGRTRPNPAVGAVVVLNGRVAGRGRHRKAGGPHAEIEAIADARRRGAKSLAGAVLYVSLEPCSTKGRTGACTDAIIAAGISRVVYAVRDPNPANRGKAARALKKAGIACERLKEPSALVERAEAIVRPFAKHVTTGLPYVTVKIAMSLDGRICDAAGDAKWISSQESRRKTNAWRNRVDAVMVGAETVRRDNPSLLPRTGPAHPGLVRVIISASGRLPRNAQVFKDGKNETLVFRDPEEALRSLGRAGISHVLCEGGMKLAVSLAEAGLVDEWTTVLAPKVIGTRPMSEAAVFAGPDVFAAWRGKGG